MIVEKQKARATLLARRRRAIIIFSLISAALIAAAVIIVSFVRIVPFTDVDGTEYHVIKKYGKYGLYDTDGNKLEAEDEYSYFVTPAGTLVDVNADTGKTQIIAQVDTENGEANSERNQLLLFPKLGQKEISSIEVSNSFGSFTFWRYDLENDRPNNKSEFVIKESPLAPFDKELFSELYVYAGYAISEYKIADPIKDANGEYSEYGLVPEERIDEEGNPYTYQPAYYIITDMNGKSHKVIVGDMLVTGEGYYVQYVEMTASGEAKRDSVYVYEATAGNTLLAPIEKFVTPKVLEQMTANDYVDVEDFSIFKYNEGSNTPEEIVNFTFIPLDERQASIRANKPYVFNGKTLAGYTPNADNISDALYNLYNTSYEGVCKLAPSDEDFVKYGLGKIETVTGADGKVTEELVLTPKYLVSFYYDVTDSNDKKKTVRQLMYVSDANENGNFYAYTFVYEGYPDGSKEEEFLYVHDMIAEVSAHSFDFLTWNQTKWISNNYVDENIAFVDKIELSSSSYSASFDLDNSKSPQDGENVSSSLLTVWAKDSEGHDTTTFADIKVTDKNGFTWTITQSEITIVNSKGVSSTSDATYYAYNTLGRKVRCVNGVITCSDGTQVRVTPDAVNITSPNGSKQSYVRFSTPLFRQFFETLLVATIVDTYELTPEEEEALIKDDSKLIMSMTVTDTEGVVKEMKFYKLTSRKAYITVNGEGGFYVMTDRVEKIVSDAQKFFSNTPIDATSKN